MTKDESHGPTMQLKVRAVDENKNPRLGRDNLVVSLVRPLKSEASKSFLGTGLPRTTYETLGHTPTRLKILWGDRAHRFRRYETKFFQTEFRSGLPGP